MSQCTRRDFIKLGSAAALSMAGASLHADPLGLPIGLQLYSVRDLLPNNPAEVLKHIGALGYREVEAAGFLGYSADKVKQFMTDAGLHCVSAHYSMSNLLKDTDGTLQFTRALGLEYVICASPGKRTPHDSPLTLDDWQWNADQLNHLGKQFKAEGMQIGYHNHVGEFADLGGSSGYDVLLKNTDPELVTLELDCGWASVAGKDPVDLLTRYSSRYSMLHVKDFKPAAGGADPAHRVPTLLGKGTIDYKPIFAAAKKAKIKHYFVEQEAFEGDPWQDLKVDYDYLHALS